MQTSGGTFQINDLKLRKGDRMQYAAGTYFKSGGTTWPQCVIGKYTSRGDFENAFYLSSTGNTLTSECYGLEIIPELLNIIAVGKIYGPTDAAAPVNFKTSSLLLLVDQNLNKLTLKIWSFTGDYPSVAGFTAIYQEARSVAVSSADGSIYITGIVKGGFTFTGAGSQHCFILRVDQDLNKIYARSFGLTGKVLTCNSIQVTRNSDFLYVGGTLMNTKSALFFAKLDALSESIIATTLESNTNQYTVRRLLLEHDKAYQTTNDNNLLYFCGFSNANSGDMLYGHLTSNDMTSLTLKLIFEYGSSSSEFTFTSSDTVPYKYGDCALTEDNAYLVGTFSSSYSATRTNAFNINKYSFTYKTPTTNNNPFYDPTWTSPSCNDISNPTLESYFIKWSEYPSTTQATYLNSLSIIADSCETNLKNQLSTYLTNYDNNLNAWRTCDFYTYKLHSPTCSVSELQFNGCNTNSKNANYNLGLYLWNFGTGYCSGCVSCYNYGCGSGACSCTQTPPITDCNPHNLCCQDCAGYLTIYNNQKWWYPSGPTCADWQFRNQAYNAEVGPKVQYDPYLFCGQVASTCAGNDGITYIEDTLFLAFEQDCYGDNNNYENLFIFRVDLSAGYSAASVATMPQAAVYFGDQGGRTYGQAIAVDEHGFIYVHGPSDAPVFGGTLSSRHSWVHVKTHWELTYELQHDQTLGYFTEHTPGYQGKRFIRPKDFHKTSLLYDSTAALPVGLSLASPTLKGYQMNERTYDLATETNAFFNPHTWKAVDFATVKSVWGYSYARLNPIQELRINKTSSIYNHSITLPTVCVERETNFDVSGNALKRTRWATKYFDFTLPKSFALGTTLTFAVTGVNVTAAPTATPSMYHLSGLLNTVASKEGKYYMMFRSSTHYYVNPKSATYKCDLPDYGFFYNDMTKESLRRFESSIRVKIVIDDINVDPPQVLKNIDDIKPVVGMRYTFSLGSISATSVLASSYFQNCNKFKVRRSLTTPGTIKTQMLPYWIKFYERNTTFVIYPDSTASSTHIEVSCCNDIDQCAQNTFQITPQNTLPTSSIQTLSQAYILQLDNTMGQEFHWQSKVVYFSDANKAPTSLTDPQYDSNALVYKSVDHTVWLDYTSILTDFKRVMHTGLLYGQATTNNYLTGPQTFTYSFYDIYSTATPTSGTFSIIMNKMPQLTTAGINYQFATIDPCANLPTTYFDQWFPFLKKEQTPITIIQTSTWFTSINSLVYAINASDNTPLPVDIFQFSPSTGQLTIDPNTFPLKSELFNLKIQVWDSFQGTAKLFKTLLINCQPKLKQIYKVLNLALNRKFSYDLRQLIFDQDGDQLTFSLPKSSDLTALQRYGIVMQDATKKITGKPDMPGTLGLVNIRATDPHGSYLDAYLTIKITDYRIKRRKNGAINGDFPDITLYEYRQFKFVLADDLFYDPQDSSPLIFFTSNLIDKELPSWLNFNPLSRTFSGTTHKAQAKPIQVRIHAMNAFSHDSLSTEFNINIIKSDHPKAKVEYFSYDLEFKQYEWFDYTIPLRLFDQKVFNDNSSYFIAGAHGQPLPSFIQFNYQNRTIYGKTDSFLGIVRIDIGFRDDIGQQAFANIKITIKPKELIKVKFLATHFLIATSVFLALILYFSYLYLWTYMTTDICNNTNSLDKAFFKKRSAERFSNYKDVRIQYFRNNNRFNNTLDNIKFALPDDKVTVDQGIEPSRGSEINLLNGEETMNHPYLNTGQQLLTNESQSSANFMFRKYDVSNNKGVVQ